jgi:hypothetical protein
VTRYISFSLYGTDLKYKNGALENAQSVSSVYPGWTAIFYCGLSIEDEFKAKLLSLGCVVEEIDALEDDSASLWRYQALFRSDAEVVLFRDSDSRLTIREAIAVSEWLESGKSMHVIRDHPNHSAAILGGAWGMRVGSLDVSDNPFSIDAYEKRYGLDQEVLRRKIYRNRSISRLIHDSYFARELSSKNLPFSNSGEFIGEVFSSDHQPDLLSRSLVQKYLHSRKFRLLTQLRGLKSMLFDLGSDTFSNLGWKNK